MLIEQGVPLRLVGAQVSNMKPDDAVVEAQVAQQAPEARKAAIKTLTDFLDQDPTGTPKMVYPMQVLQELTRTADLPDGHQWFEPKHPPFADAAMKSLSPHDRFSSRGVRSGVASWGSKVHDIVGAAALLADRSWFIEEEAIWQTRFGSA